MQQRNRLLISSLVWTTALIGACHHSDRPEAEDVKRVVGNLEARTEAVAEDARREIIDARKDASKSAAQTKAAVRSQLERLDAKFETLERDSKAAGRELDREVLDARRDARAAVDDLDHATEDAWDDTREATADALEKLEGAIGEARAKVEPSS